MRLNLALLAWLLAVAALVLIPWHIGYYRVSCNIPVDG